MTSLDEQPELALSRPPAKVNVPLELIYSRRSAAAAFTLACDTSTLEDKEIYLPLGIDAGYFSRIKKGLASLDADKVKDFCRIVGNKIYPQWLAYQVGCGLVVLKTEAELRAEAAEARAEKAEKKLEWALELINSRFGNGA